GGNHLHISEIVFKARTAHSSPDDIDESEDAGVLAVDDVLFEVFEVAPAGAAGIADGGYAIAKGEAVRPDAVVAGIGVSFTSGSVIVRVNVNQPRRDVIAGYIDGLGRIAGIEVVGYGRDFAIFDRDVHDAINVIFRVDDMPVLEQQVIRQGIGGRTDVVSGSRV